MPQPPSHRDERRAKREPVDPESLLGLTITGLRPTGSQGQTTHVKVGRHVAAKIDTDACAALRLHVGDTWTHDLAQRVESVASEHAALQDALRRVTRRMTSRRRLDDKLRLAGHEAHARAAALDRLETSGLLDDESLGRALLREAERQKPAGPALLKQKLYRAGIPSPLIDQLMRERQAQPEALADVKDRALAMLKRKAQTMSRLDDATRRRRLLGFISRRGFDGATSRELVESALGPVEFED